MISPQGLSLDLVITNTCLIQRCHSFSFLSVAYSSVHRIPSLAPLGDQSIGPTLEFFSFLSLCSFTFPHCWSLRVIVTKGLKEMKKKKAMLWLTILEVSISGHLGPVLWVYSKAEYHGEEDVARHGSSYTYMRALTMYA